MEWSDALRAKEAARMAQLEGAYAEREGERRQRFTRVQAELAQLEAQLRRALADVRPPMSCRRRGWI